MRKKTSDLISDSCDVNNGGCDKNADCSHCGKTNGVICTCKNGFTNVGTADKVVCKGNFCPYLS